MKILVNRKRIFRFAAEHKHDKISERQLLKLFNKYRATFDKEIPYFIDYEIAMIEQGFCADYLKILQLFCSESSRLDIKFSRDDIELIQVIIKDIRCFWQEPEDIEALENVFKLLCE